MALCLAIEKTPTGASKNVQSVSGYHDLPWSLGPAVLTDGVYSCATGTHLLLTVGEVNAPPSLSVAPEQVAKAYGWGLGTVLVLWAIGWSVGVLVGVIRKG